MPHESYSGPDSKTGFLIAMPALQRPKRPEWAHGFSKYKANHFEYEFWIAPPLGGFRVSDAYGRIASFREFWSSFPGGAGPELHEGPWEVWWTPTTTALQLTKGRKERKIRREVRLSEGMSKLRSLVAAIDHQKVNSVNLFLQEKLKSPELETQFSRPPFRPIGKSSPTNSPVSETS